MKINRDIDSIIGIIITAIMVIAIIYAIVATSNAWGDLFSSQKNTPVGVASPTTKTAIKNKTTVKNGSYFNKPNIAKSFPTGKVRSIVDNIRAHNPKYFRQATKCDCDYCKSDNKVIFYFLINSFSKRDIAKAVRLAKSHGLVPIINIETTHKLLNEQAYIDAFNSIEDRIPFSAIKHVSVEYDSNAVKDIKRNHKGNYFRFDSIYGFRMGGSIEDFNKLYRTAFGR